MLIDHHALFKPITKATLPLSGAASSRPSGGGPSDHALSEPRGPVHLDLPEDVALAPTNEQVVASRIRQRWPPHPTPPSRGRRS